MTHYDATHHTRGESLYVDDVAPPHGMLHAAVYGSPSAHGRLRSLDISEALAAPGVRAVLTAKDIPGHNNLGPIIADEELLATDEVYYIGQPVALVLAEMPEQARDAVHLIKAEIDPLEVVVDPRVSFARGDFIATPRTFELGDTDQAWDKCDVVVEGRCDIAGQEHLYLETQRARAIPGEGDRVQLFASTQSPYAVQKAAAKVLGVPQHRVEVDVLRLGGGFGGKEDQATAWACLVAVAARCTGQAVQLVLHRLDDLLMTGKRHPYSADFKLGLDADGKFVAYEATLYQNSGAKADLSTAVLERSLFHATNAYNIPNTRVLAACCRTNLHPHTAFRGFGGPQSMFVIEAAIAKASEKTGIAREELQRRNLLRDGDVFPYGQVIERAMGEKTWDDAIKEFGWQGLREEANAHNAKGGATRKGLAIMPVCFGISFTKLFLNQASALVHVYTDGSVSISTGGVEMGQGVNSKLRDIAARAFGISTDRITLESTNTTRVANMSPSAASATSDLNGNATLDAVDQIQRRLMIMAAKELEVDDTSRLSMANEALLLDGQPTGWDWEKLASTAYISRVDLSAHGFYATPGLSFAAATETAAPFPSPAWGAAIVGVTVDVLRGIYSIDTVRLSHDLGRTVNPLVDMGQIEGGLAQGLGWMTLEELAYDDKGRLLSKALSTYKAPDVFFMPDDLQVRFLESENPTGPYGSKAVGEPPFMYGIGVYFAIRDAVRAFVGDSDIPFTAPASPEQVLMALHGGAFEGSLQTRASRPTGGGAVSAPLQDHE